MGSLKNGVENPKNITLTLTITKTNMYEVYEPDASAGIEPGSHRWQRCILPLDH